VTSTEIRGTATIGLDLTAAVRAAMLKYPWTRMTFPQPHPSTMDPIPRGATPPPDDPESGSTKFGAYTTELTDLQHAREPFFGKVADWQQTVEASIMDTADDIAYAIHDVEDFHRVGVLQSGAVAAEFMAWQREAGQFADLPDDLLATGARRPGYPTERLRRQIQRKDAWISDDDAFATAVEHVRKELVDGLLAVSFDGPIEAEQSVAGFSARWTRRLVDAIEVVEKPSVRSGHVVLGVAQWHEVQILKSVHRRFVLTRPDLALHQRGQARLLTTLVESLLGWIADPEESARLPQRLHDLIDLAEAELATGSDGKEPIGATRQQRARGRAIIDFVAALTDGQAVALMDALSGRSGQLWTDALVL
jgi:dGTPase